MPAQRSDTPTGLPPSLRNFLTVTNSDGTPRETHVQPSSLLSRIETFLPQLKAANELLTAQESAQSVVQLEKVVASPADKGKGNRNDADKEESDLRIDMDLYVDNSLGTLVASDIGADCEQEAKDDESAGQWRKRPVIEVLSPQDAAAGAQLPSKKLAKKGTKFAPP